MSLAEVNTPFGDEDDRGRGSGSAPDRTPPQDLMAEQSVLGAMLMSKDAIADVVEVLRGPDFYRPSHELVYDAILDLYGRGEPADAITVAAELTKRGDIGRVGGAPYLHDLLASVSIAANAGYYAEIVREKGILRRLADASIRIGQSAYAAEGDVNDIVDRAQAEVYSVTDQRTSEDYKSLSELMQPTMDEIEAIGSRGGQLAGVPTGFADLDDLTNGMHPGQMIIVAARPGMGKALALDTPLPTPDGWTTMGQVAVGDQLIGADGRPTRVLAATEVMTDRECFEVVFSDGTRVVADAGHEWQVTEPAARRAAGSRSAPDDAAVRRVLLAAAQAQHRPENYLPGPDLVAEIGAEFHGTVQSVLRQIGPAVAVRSTATTDQTAAATTECRVVYPRNRTLSCVAARLTAGDRPEIRSAETVTTAELSRRLRAAGGRRWSVRTTDPVAGRQRDLPLPPYALGAWLGDGHPEAARLSSADPEVPALIAETGVPVDRLSGLSWALLEPRSDGRPPAAGRTGSLRPMLRRLGVLGAKHIPADYLRASIGQRRDLLAGLLDTAGWVADSGNVRLAVADRRLADDAYELITSLGYRCRRRTSAADGGTIEVLSLQAADDVFRLPRKRDHHRSRRISDPARAGRRQIVAVRPHAGVPVRCVQVDNQDHLYLATRSMIPTHNSTIGLDLARSASIKSGLASAIFSLEMSQIEIVMRLLSAEASIPLNHIRNGKMNDDDWQRMAKKMGEVAEAPLFIDDSPNLTMMEIRAKARRLRQRHDLKLIIIDYLQLLTSGKKVESRQVEVSEFSRQLKLLAKELELPVIALAQLNRGPETRGGDKKPMLSDLRESGSLEQDADMVILLNRPDIYDKESERAGEADFDVAKHRNGPTKTITVAFQGHYSRFIDMHH
ncbi:replicative DNA helicase [Microlunatus soli]|uniref:Replicative DNA helicase n=1 Tax=Microlunatus soli TaxID=630515 RepID=A0A1H1UP72_9ACTN|nr:replicative DNA helicase [Microlunatus soli]SDS74332.1 replicative DNA helicase [Microlunatus soli]